MSKGVAYIQSLQSYATTLQSLGFDFVIRCYSVANAAQNLTTEEVQAYTGASLSIVPFWGDGTPNSLSYFTFENGISDGRQALACAVAVGQNETTPVYFMINYDATQADIEGGIANYFYGVQKAFTTSDGIPLYAIGIYGSGLVCSNLPGILGDTTDSMYTWLADAPGWNNDSNFTGYNMRQYQWQLSYPSESLAFGINYAPNDDPGSFSLL